MTKCCYVVTEFFQDQEFSYSDKVLVYRDKVGQVGQVLCCDREIDVAIELSKIESR